MSSQKSESAPLAYTIQQATEKTGLSRTTWWRLIAANKVVARRVGRRVLISAASLESFLKKDHSIPSDDELKELREKRQAENCDEPSPRSSARRRRGSDEGGRGS